jgi:hypothetical protein
MPAVTPVVAAKVSVVPLLAAVVARFTVVLSASPCVIRFQREMPAV